MESKVTAKTRLSLSVNCNSLLSCWKVKPCGNQLQPCLEKVCDKNRAVHSNVVLISYYFKYGLLNISIVLYLAFCSHISVFLVVIQPISELIILNSIHWIHPSVLCLCLFIGKLLLKQHSPNITVVIVYFHNEKINHSHFDNIINNFQFVKTSFKIITNEIKVTDQSSFL